MKTLLGIDLTDEEFDNLLCEQAKGKELKIVDGKIVAFEHIITEEEKKQQEINLLKDNLQKTDYVANKLAEANARFILTNDKNELESLYKKYEITLAQRKIWRERIGGLQNL